MAKPPALDPHQIDDERQRAAAVLRAEAQAVATMAEDLGEAFHDAVSLIHGCAHRGGSVLVSGLGKSGLIGAKISATFASLGIPSHPVHPTEAAHGDLGRFRSTDAMIALSFSGETEEVVNLAALIRQDELPIISICGESSEGNPSTLERLSTVALTIRADDEAAGGGFLAPTASTTATMAMGDALALAVARRMQFSNADFARRHPGGSLGGMLRPVIELLRFRVGHGLTPIPHDASVRDALTQASGEGRRPGALLLVEPIGGKLSGIFTDGDLRRLILNSPGQLERPIQEVMTKEPRTISDSAFAGDAVRMVREHRQDEIPVVDDRGRPVGVLDVQDLMAMRLVQG
jgi:arabinose-5-phosphate isomerase